jgi:hypothetical protein
MEIMLVLFIGLLVIVAVNATSTSPLRGLSVFLAAALSIMVVAVQLDSPRPFFTMTDNFVDNTCAVTTGTASLSIFKRRITSFIVNQPCSDALREQMKPIIDGFKQQANTSNTGEKK